MDRAARPAAATEPMTYQRIKQGKIADAIVEQLEKLILDGVLEPGERLPSERDLAQQMDVSRPSLREAIQRLETIGLVETRQGDGTVVKSALASTLTDPLVYLLQTRADAAMDYLELRRTLEGMAGYYAALRATDADREILRVRFERMEELHSLDDPMHEADADADFHLAIAEASHNVVLLHIVRGLFKLLREGVFYNRRRLYTRKGARDVLLEQHRALYKAVMEGDPQAASEAARGHMTFVQDSLQEMGREERREEVSQRRLERMQSAEAK